MKTYTAEEIALMTKEELNAIREGVISVEEAAAIKRRKERIRGIITNIQAAVRNVKKNNNAINKAWEDFEELEAKSALGYVWSTTKTEVVGGLNWYYKDFVNNHNPTIEELNELNSHMETIERRTIHYKVFYQRDTDIELEVYESKLHIEDDSKIDEYSITGNYRKYSPKGIYSKLVEKNGRAIHLSEMAKTNQDLVMRAKMRILTDYPDVEITDVTSSVSNVKLSVKFPNGSSINLGVSSWDDEPLRITLRDKYDSIRAAYEWTDWADQFKKDSESIDS